MSVWIVYDKGRDEILGSYNADIWNKLDIREDVLMSNDMSSFAFQQNCTLFLEEI